MTEETFNKARKIKGFIFGIDYDIERILSIKDRKDDDEFQFLKSIVSKYVNTARARLEEEFDSI